MRLPLRLIALMTVALLALPVLAPVRASIRSSPSYTLSRESLDSGGASFSGSYAQRSVLGNVSGVSVQTPPDATARFLWHGFVPGLDPPLFAVANLSLTLEVSPILSTPQEPVVCSGTVTNHGPEFAPEVTLTLVLLPNITYVGATLSQGSASASGNQVQCKLGILPAGGVATYAIRVTPNANGPALLALTAAPEAVDLDFGGNSAEAQTAVVTGLHFTKPGGGSWHQPFHWTPPIVPTAEHKVFIDDDIVDLYTTHATVAGLVLTGGRIGGGNRLTVTTLAEWSGGELQSGTTLAIAPGGLLRITGAAGVNLVNGAGIENRGTVLLETYLQSVFGGWVTNYGLFEVAGNRSFLRYQDSGFTFDNLSGAVFRRTSGEGTNGIVVAFRNSGLVENLTGGLDFRGGFINGGWTLINSGTLRAASGSEILYTRAQNFLQGTTFEGPGAHRILAATTGPNDGCQFAGDIHGDFTIAYGWMGGTFTNTGQIIWAGGDFRSGGTWTVAPGGMVTLTGAGDRALVNGYSLRNLGTLRLAGASLGASGGGTVDNLSLLDLAGDYSVRSTVVLSNRTTGILRKSAGTGNSALTSSFYQEGGTLDLWTGTLALAGGYSPTPTSTLRVVIGGVTPGTQFSRLTAVGAAGLAGTLVVTPANGFVPAASDTFAILSASARTGVFNVFNATPPDAGAAFQPQYLASGVQLSMVPVRPTLDPGSLSYQSGNFQISFRGGAGGVYVIEGTTELGTTAVWLPLQTNVSTGAPMLFEDATAGLLPQRFYRVSLRP